MEAAKVRLARGYSSKAMQYDLLAGHLYRAGVRRLLPLVRVPPMPAILDVGSGTGVNLLEAARWFAPARLLCGIDLSPGMVEVARAKAAMAGVPAQFIVGDAEKLPYPDKTFDLVICNSVLQWIDWVIDTDVLSLTQVGELTRNQGELSYTAEQTTIRSFQALSRQFPVAATGSVARVALTDWTNSAGLTFAPEANLP